MKPIGIGQQLYLFKNPFNQNASELIIDAHGFYGFKFIPKHSHELRFYSKFGDPVLDNDIPSKGNLPLRSMMLSIMTDHFDHLDKYKVKENKETINVSPNNYAQDYYLIKYKGPGDSVKFSDRCNRIFEDFNYAYVLGSSNCDIVTVRNRWFDTEIRLSTILKTNPLYSYKVIHCCFCRRRRPLLYNKRHHRL